MDELLTLFKPHIARLRKMGVKGDIMIIPSAMESVDAKTGRRSEQECFGRWSLFVCGKLITSKSTWAEVEDGVREIVSGRRKEVIEKKRKEK